MPTCIFILARFTLRVDNVLFRTHDTRLYHSFASKPPLVVRETSGWEAPYDRVKGVRLATCVFLFILLYPFLTGSSPPRRPHAAHRPDLHCQGAHWHAAPSVPRGGREHRLARARDEGGSCGAWLTDGTGQGSEKKYCNIQSRVHYEQHFSWRSRVFSALYI
jgi:hypothetical protein